MNKLIACIKKDLLLLFRDKVGLLFMFLMPVTLAIIITVVQNSTFDLVNNNKIKLLIENKDSSETGKKFSALIKKTGLFRCTYSTGSASQDDIESRMRESESVVALLIPERFGKTMTAKTSADVSNILKDLGMEGAAQHNKFEEMDLQLIYDPVLQQSFRYSIRRSIESALQIIESENLIKSLYSNFEVKPGDTDSAFPQRGIKLSEKTMGEQRAVSIPNATQHNIPAWTVFAMFFIVVSLGSSIVKEKLNGSFLRLRTMPVNFMINILSKEITYLTVAFLQAVVIFTVGALFFEKLGLPPLQLPSSIFLLFLVVFFSGLCAISVAICLGVFAQTQEQNNGLGAGLVILLAAMGGIIVPYFVMPGFFQDLLHISPMYWCLKAFYGVFLEEGGIKDIFMALIPIMIMTVALHLLAFWGLKRKQLI